MTSIQTPGGYESEEPDFEGRDDVVINLPYMEAYNIILDALQGEASGEPLTTATFTGNAQTILELLLDACAEDNDEAHYDEEYRKK